MREIYEYDVVIDYLKWIHKDGRSEDIWGLRVLDSMHEHFTSITSNGNITGVRIKV